MAHGQLFSHRPADFTEAGDSGAKCLWEGGFGVKMTGNGGGRGVFWGWRIGSLSDASKKLFGIGLKICYLIRTSIMGSLKKRRKAKINKHKRRKKLRLNRHKKRTWQK